MTALHSLCYAAMPPAVADALAAVLPPRRPQNKPGDTGMPLAPLLWTAAGDCACVYRVSRREPYAYRNVSTRHARTVRRWYVSTRYRVAHVEYWAAVCRQGAPARLYGPFAGRDEAAAWARGWVSATAVEN